MRKEESLYNHWYKRQRKLFFICESCIITVCFLLLFFSRSTPLLFGDIALIFVFAMRLDNYTNERKTVSDEPPVVTDTNFSKRNF